MKISEVLEAWSSFVGPAEIRSLKAERVWEVSAANGVRYALKRVMSFEAKNPIRRLSEQARILDFVAQKGLPVAVPVLSDDGLVYAADDQDRLYVLLPMLPPDNSPSDNLQASEDVHRNTGSTFARMHVALADCPYVIDSWQFRPDRLDEALSNIRTGVPAKTFEGLAARVESWREAILRALDDPKPQRIHGDAHGANILTDDRTVVGIIDADHLPIGPRIYDVSYFLAHWIHWPILQNDPASVTPDAIASVTRSLLTGYNSVSLLSEREADGIPALTLAVCLFLLGYLVHSAGFVDQSWIDTANWIVAYPETLRL